MNVYDDIVDATVVCDAVSGNFTTLRYRELIIAKTDLLCVYRFSGKKRLQMVYEFKLSGKVTGLELVGSPERKAVGEKQLDMLAISTGVAKISVVKFNELSCSLECVSLHYYEDKFAEQSLVSLQETSSLRTDLSKNYTLLYNGDNLAFIQFGSELKIEEDDDDDENKEEKLNQSLILKSKDLHTSIQNVIDIQFLQKFSKPTVAILYQPQLAWIGNSKLVKLPTKLIIIGLNIDQEYKTTIIGEVSDLPWDLHTAVPLSSGTILVGCNELIYVDNTGAVQSTIFLNSFADKNFKRGKIVDSSKQEIILDEKIKFFVSHNTGQEKDDIILLMDQKNNFYLVQIDLEGRLLTTFKIHKLPILNDTMIENSLPTCVTCLGVSRTKKILDLFLGYQSGDALALRFNNINSVLTTTTIKSNEISADGVSSLNLENSDQDDEEEDLYGHETKESEIEKKEITVENAQPFHIEMLTSVKNIGPITSLTIGKEASIQPNIMGLANPNQNEFLFMATSGTNTGSHLTAIKPSVQPDVELALRFTSVTQIWNLKFKGKDRFLVTTDSKRSKSDIYRIGKSFKLFKEGKYRRDATTVFTSMFGEEKRIVQVTTNHLYLYDLNFRRLTTMNFEWEVVNVSVMEPYILITLSRGDIKLYELDVKHKKRLFRVELPKILPELVITSGVVLKSNMCNEFLLNKDKTKEELLFTFVTADNQIIFFTRDHNDKIFQLNGVDDLAEMLYISTYQLNEEVVPDPQIKQVMINSIGSTFKEEYLTILTFGGEVYQYKKSALRSSRFFKNSSRNNLKISGAPENAYPKGVRDIERSLHYIPHYNGHSVIFVTGSVPYIIIKEDDSVPRIFKFSNIPLVSMTSWGDKSVMAIDDLKNARVFTLDRNNMYYGNQLPLKKIKLSDTMEDYQTLTKITYHERSQLYIVAYSKSIDYKALAEDGEELVGSNPDVPHAKNFKSGILLVNPKTWNVIDSKEFDDNTLISDMRSMVIQVNSKTKLKKELIVVGISYINTEDLPSEGAFHIFNPNEVVPEPGKPDTNYRLKEIFHETVRGNVNSVCEVSGRFIINQSQKLMVRDIQEDESVVPVAFHDTPVFVTDTKTFGNMVVIGDAMQGFQLVGFDAEPYRMIPLGRSVDNFKTMAIEFLINSGELYFAVSDQSNTLHILKYAPDEPNSLSGQRLAHYSSFNLHSTNTCMLLVPANNEFSSNPNVITAYQIVGGNVDGSLFKVLPLSEDSFRRLYVIQQQLIDNEIQTAGLNPRMERLSNEYYQSTHLMRPLLDYNVIKKFSSLPINRRKKLAQKAGRRANFELWRDLINIEFSLSTMCRT